MFVIECPHLSLDQLYKSGQVFRWLKASENKFVVTHGDRAVKVMQQKDRLAFNCGEEEFYDVWYDYFDMGTDYGELNHAISGCGKYLKACSVRASGVRILRQDLFETVVSFIISQQQNIPRIRAILDKMCSTMGVKHAQGMSECGRVVWYEFPTPERILQNVDKLDACGLGYRKPYVLGAAQAALDGWLDYEFLSTLTYDAAKSYFMEFDGIGPKVADCICLYALHHMQAFPVDTHIQQILQREYKTNEPDTFCQDYIPGVKDCAGLVQQYLFYCETNKPRELW